MKIILLVGLSIYRSVGSLWLGGACRFEPSCSAYARDALSKYPPTKALRLTVGRLCRCRPGGGCGYDPVPEPQGDLS